MAEITPRGKNRWLVRIYKGRIDGKIDYHNRVFHGLEKDAKKFARQLETKRDLGTLTQGEGQTFKQFVEWWLKEVKEKKIRARTLAHYKHILDLYVLPGFGESKLTEIKHESLQAYYNEMADEGYSRGTVKYVHGLLHQPLGHATRLEYIPKNPTDFLTLPPDKSKEIEVMDVEQSRDFIQALNGEMHGTAFLTAISIGPRPSEYTAFKWSDLDFTKQEISISRTVVYPKDGGHWYFDEPKTKNSVRVVDVPPTLMAALLGHKRHQAELRLKSGPKWENHDLIFSTRTGEPLDQRYLNKLLLRILKKAGIEKNLTIYCLRHTYATLALAQGMNDKIVSDAMGHASVSFTKDRYQHVLKSMKVKARDTIEAILFG